MLSLKQCSGVEYATALKLHGLNHAQPRVRYAALSEPLHISGPHLQWGDLTAFLRDSGSVVTAFGKFPLTGGLF